MKIKQKVTREIDVAQVILTVPVNYGTEDMPENFPGRNGDTWEILIDIETGEWHPFGFVKGQFAWGGSLALHMKVCDECTVDLRSNFATPIKREYYVPSWFPGNHYGDYIIFELRGNKIANWKVDPEELTAWVNETEDENE